MLKYANDKNNYELFPGNKCDTLESIKNYLKNWQLYGYHMAGTAKMGKNDDNMSVVDSRLRVHGVKNLRVVDASVYPAPHLHAFNISRGVYLIAEVASDFIKNES
jgi:choline dehydrogenase